jgi:hypothetical protein
VKDESAARPSRDTKNLYWRPTTEDRVAKALGEARDKLVSMQRQPNGTDVVFEVIKDMADIQRRLDNLDSTDRTCH